MKKVGKIILIIFLIGFIIGVFSLMTGVIMYNSSLKPVATSDGQEIEIEIKEGLRIAEIASLLKEKNVIKNDFFFKVYLKINGQTNLQAGKYTFNNGTDDVKAIVEKMGKGNVVNETVELSIIEGKNVKAIAKSIADVTNNREDDIYDLLRDEKYLDSLIKEYWFITEEIKEEGIIYPLEGYLFPAKYTLKNADVSVKEIFKVILDNTDKVLTTYREDIENGGITVHQILTLASITELEGTNYDNRSEIIGVFFNRLDKNMTLGSDVTTYYAVQKDLAAGDLTKEDLKKDSPYNTRLDSMKGVIPIGPICNPSSESIKATLNPKETTALFFVADKQKHIYFSDTNAEHEAMIKDLKNSNLWIEY